MHDLATSSDEDMMSSIQISSLETFEQHDQYQKIKLEEEEENRYLVENHVDGIGLDLKDNSKRFIFEV